jgi:hypothetical protein
MQYARRELLADLARNKPALVVVQSRDVFPSVTGDALDSRDSLPGFPELQWLIDTQYTFSKKVEDFDLYTRNR